MRSRFIIDVPTDRRAHLSRSGSVLILPEALQRAGPFTTPWRVSPSLPLPPLRCGRKLAFQSLEGALAALRSGRGASADEEVLRSISEVFRLRKSAALLAQVGLWEDAKQCFHPYQIQPEYGDEQADAGRECRTHLARPNSQARTVTGKY